MNHRFFTLALASLSLLALPAQAVTITVTADTLYEADGTSPLAMGTTVMVIADRDNDGFGNLTSANQASDTAFINDADDVILDRWALDGTGNTIRNIFFNLGDNGVNAGDPLILVWYAGLQENTNPTAPGAARKFGTFRSDSGDDFGGSAWVVPGSNGDTISLNLLTQSIGGNLPESEGVADQVTIGQGENVPPIAICRDVTNAASASCEANVSATDVDNGSSDPDGSIVSRILTPAGPFSVGTTPVTLTVVDDAGASNSCAAVVVVVDLTAPTVTCPGNISTNIAAGVTNAVVSYATPAPSDNCPGATVNCVPASGAAFPLGMTTVTCTATDGAGNTGGCTFSVSVLTDTAPPVALCRSVTNAADAGCQATVSAAAVDNGSFDPDGGPVTLSLNPSGPFELGTTPVTLTVVDDENTTNTCAASVTVIDNTPPSVTCPSNISVVAAAGQCAATVNYDTPTATDHCGGATVECAPASGSSFPVGQTSVVCTATDGGSNTAGCTFSVTVNDTEAPVIACPDDIAIGTDSNSCSAVVSFATPGASDNCSSTTVSCAPASGSAFPIGETTITCTANDGNGNTAICSFRVTVSDDDAPTITCPANIVTNVLVPAESAVVSFTPSSADNCGSPTVVCVPASGSTFPLGEITVTCTATDAANNTNQCAFTVTVTQSQPQADLRVTKQDIPDPVTVGIDLTYVIVVTNAGAATATSVIVVDTLPESVTFQSSSLGCQSISNVVTCNVGDIAPRGFATIAVVVTPSSVGAITNTVAVSANESDANPADNTVSQVTQVNPAPPAQDVDLSGSWAKEGPTEKCKSKQGALECKLKGTFTVANTGTAEAVGVVVRMLLSEDALPGGDLALGPDQQLGSIKPGKSVKAKLKLDLPAGTTASGRYIIAVMDPDGVVSETDESNNVVVFGPMP